MSRVLRWRLGLLLFALALVRPAANAQPLNGGQTDAAVQPTNGAQPATPGNPADPGAAVTPRTPEQPAAGSSLLGDTRPPQAVAPRPDPSAEQQASLRLLEEEVNGFLTRGMGFRTSINGLLAREHDRQLARLRTGFERQIRAERDAEREARRHAIEVFERFLQTYPEDRERTPDVMFRLAELYYDEAAYAKLEADERTDREIAARRAQNLPTDDIVAPPQDFRCSILLYRHIIARFPQFRLGDATHYLLGWVLKEMGREDESISAYRGLVCPGSFHYDGEHGLDLMAPLGNSSPPVMCPNLFDMLRPRGPELISPAVAADADAGAGADAAAPPAATPELAPNQTAPIPQLYAQCQPMRGPNGQPSRYAGEVFYYVGDWHFDNARDDDGNALAIAAYQASMRLSTRPRPPQPANRAPAEGIAGAGENVVQMPAEARAQFDANLEYGAFWSKSLYKVGWAYFRMQNGYPQALRNFSLLLDYYDYAGAEEAARGNRSDTIKWVGVIFSESDWGLGPGEDATRCQGVVESISRPPPDATRPFDCAGIMRIVSPGDPTQIQARRWANRDERPPAVPGRPTYIPQNRPWTPDAYLELADDYFQQTKYYEAITIYSIFLSLYPLHERAPRVVVRIADSYSRQRQFDAAIRARGALAQFTEGTEWWNNNNNHPEAQRYADTVARNSLHDLAITHHQNATQLRQQAVRRGIEARSLTGAAQAEAFNEYRQALQRANEEYHTAVEAYTQFIRNYPNDEAAYEFRYNRADALYWSQDYAEAARAYADVRESNENDQYLAAAAYMAVKAQEAFIRREAQLRRLDPCIAVRAGIAPAEIVDDTGARLIADDAAEACTRPPMTGQTVNPLNIPDAVRGLMEARNAYANRVPEGLDNAAALRDVVEEDPEQPYSNPPYRAKFFYLNARTFFRFGQVDTEINPNAVGMYREVLTRYCNDQLVAGAAFADLNNLYVLQGDQEAQENLAQEQSRRQCAGVRSEVIGQVLTDRTFRLALDTFHRAEQTRDPAQSRALYEQAARQMQEAVEANRNHPQAALATFYTALAYERTGRFDTATQTYVRITNEYNNTRDAQGHELEGENLAQRINILEVSNFRAGVNLERIYDYDQAIRYYGNVVNDQRFARANDHDAHVHDSLASIALINTNLGRWSQARQAWTNFIPRANPGAERSEAEFQAANIPYRAQEWGEAIRSLQEYLRRYPATAENARYRVRAQYNIALAYRAQNNDAQYRRALREVVQVYRATGQQAGSPAAAYAAEALFRDLDDQVTEFTRTEFQAGDSASLTRQIQERQTRLQAIDTAARDVVALRGGEYSIGALTRQGEAHEHLATQEQRIGSLLQLSAAERATEQRARNAITQCRTAAQRLERINPDRAQETMDRCQQAEDNLNNQIEERRQRAQAAFDQQATDERKLAIINYGTAVYTARQQNIPTPFASRALERLRLEENQPLIEQALSQQQVFQYRQGMFDGEAPGAVLPQTSPVAAPGLATE